MRILQQFNSFKMLQRFNIVCVLTTINCFAVSLGCVAPLNGRAYGLFAFCLMVVLNAGVILRMGMECRRLVWVGLRILGMLGCLGAILSVNRPYVWLIWYVPLLYLFLDLSNNQSQKPPQTYLVWTAFGFAVCYAVSFHSSYVWPLLQALSVTGSRLLGQLTGTQVVLGATGAGFWVFLSCFLCLLFAYLQEYRKGTSKRAIFVLATGYLVIVSLVYVAFGHILSQNLYRMLFGTFRIIGRVNFAATSINSPILLFLLGTGIAVVFVPQMAMSFGSEVQVSRPRAIKIFAVLGVVVFAATVMLYFPITQADSSKRQITFYGKGLLGWHTPQFEMYGISRGGMFGLWPKYLEAMGYHPLILNEETLLSPAILEETQVLVVINLKEQFSDEHQQMIWRYVAKGGSLLVLGDHTDLMGIMKPLNHLLQPVNIRFRFDSAFTATRWFNAYELFPHPITASLDYSNDKLQHSTGASLDVAPPAYPIINAKFAFSDKGNYDNSNGYLGDYLYQLGEQLGDIAVVAGATYGKGKVIVFGDTSAFQNVAFYHSHEFVNRLFSHLTRSTRLTVFKWVGWALLLGIVVVCSIVPATRTLLALPILSAAVGTALLLGHALFLPLSAPVRPCTGNLAYVDASHVNQYSLTHWKKNSIGGLNINLARNGYLPMILRNRRIEAILDAKIYVVIAPTKPFSRDELKVLQAYMQSGGQLILAVGWEEKAGAQTLLDFLGVDIASVPLGPVPIHEPTMDKKFIRSIQMKPHFMEAWPIFYQDSSDIKVLYAFKDYPIVIHKSLGKGGAVIIADTQFLYDRTLEQEKAWWEGNITFLRQLLESEFSGGTQE